MALPSDEVTLPSGEKVLVHAMSRADIHAMKKYADGDTYKGEVFLVAKARQWSVEQADEWLNNVTPGEAQPVVEKVAELSGLDDGPKDS